MSNWRRTGTFSGYQDPPSIYRKKKRTSKQSKKPRMWRPGYDSTRGWTGRTGLTREIKFKDTFYDQGDTEDGVPSGRIWGVGSALAGGPNMLQIAQGNNESQRIGRKIAVVGLYVKGQILHLEESFASRSGGTARLVIFQDKQTNSAGLGPDDSEFVITEMASSSGNYKGVMGYRNLQYVNRFKILMDELLDINMTAGYKSTDTGTGFGRKVCYFEKYINFNKPVPIEYTGNTGDVSEITSNSFGGIILYEGGAPEGTEADDNSISFRVNVRVKYIDS